MGTDLHVSSYSKMKPFWNKLASEVSERIWLPQNVGEDPRRHPPGWHRTSIYHTKDPPLDDSWLTVEPAVKDPNGFKVKKIRLIPSKEQKVILDGWFDDARWTYNTANKIIKAQGIYAKKELRAQCVNAAALKENGGEFVLKTPYEIRDAALLELLIAYKTAFSRQRAGTIETFTIKFRSKKAPSQSILLHARSWNNGIPNKQAWNGEKLRGTEPLPAILDNDTKLQRTRLGKYYLCVIEPIVLRAENQGSKKIIALDPGVRKFLTGYDNMGNILEFGKCDIDRIHSVCAIIDKLNSAIEKEPNNRRKKRLRRAVLRYYQKIRNRIDDAHKKIAKHLCENYVIILLPKFETQKMIKKGKRKIGRKTAREMMSWSHCKFQQRLISKSREYPCSVEIVTEEYTSKTCTRCGKLNKSLGSSETFNCPTCKLTIDRDWNGARNIYLKYFSRPEVTKIEYLVRSTFFLLRPGLPPLEVQ